MDTKRCGGWRFTLQTNSVRGKPRNNKDYNPYYPYYSVWEARRCGSRSYPTPMPVYAIFLPAVWYEIETAN